jgi:hypothetical protein
MLAVLLACALSALPKAPAVVEFYAPWCPVCARFRPQFDAVSYHVSPPVNVATVNCDEVDCTVWGVRAYPTVVMLQASGSVDVFRGPYTADALISWLDKNGVVFVTYPQIDAGSGDSDRLDDVFVDVPVATPANAFTGFEMLVKLPAKTPGEYLTATGLLKALSALPGGERRYKCMFASVTSGGTGKECPKADQPQSREFCKSIYPCSVWAMLHMLVARAANDVEAVEILAHGSKAILLWFECKECVSHFNSMIEGESGSFALASVKGKRGAMLWLWSAHNFVNERTQKPVFPPENVCPGCSSETDIVNLLHVVYGDSVQGTRQSYSAESRDVAIGVAVFLVFACFFIACVMLCKCTVSQSQPTTSDVETLLTEDCTANNGDNGCEDTDSSDADSPVGVEAGSIPMVPLADIADESTST